MKLEDLKFDKRNYRRHSEKNQSLIKKSIEEVGFGRSIVVDADNEIVCVHIPNGFPIGGVNKFAYMNMMKAQGFKSGFPDLMVFAKNQKHNILFLEFKREKGGIVSKSQKDWIQWLNGNGYCAKVVKGNVEAVEVLENYLRNLD